MAKSLGFVVVITDRSTGKKRATGGEKPKPEPKMSATDAPCSKCGTFTYYADQLCGVCR